MIHELDEVLRRLLIRELPVKNGEVNIVFDQPKREWSARLSRPTLNLFLHDVRENNTLRQTEWQVKRNGNGTVTKQRTPVRMDLHYLITAWATQVDDEHQLMTHTLLALFRYPTLPEDMLPTSLKGQPVPIPINVAQAEEVTKPADLWGVLDNELRPAIACIITLALNPYQTFTGPVVKTRDLRFRQPGEAEPQDRFWMVGGRLRGAGPFDNLHLMLKERGLDVPVAAEGDFIIGNLEAGQYTLTVSSEGRPPQERQITVPSPAYDIDLEGGTAQAPVHSHAR